MSIYRKIAYTLFAIPIGAAGGFICAVIIVSSCTMFGVFFDHPQAEPFDWKLMGSYIITAAIIPGAFLGCILLPIAYISLFINLPGHSLLRAGLWIAIAVLGGGLLWSPGREVFSLFGTLAGFGFGLWIAYDKTHGV